MLRGGLFFLIFGLVACDNINDEQLSEVTWDYPGDKYFLSEKQMRSCSVHSPKRTIHIKLNHNLNQNLSEFDIRVSINGTVYLGEYKTDIIIKDFCVSEEANDSFSVQLIDKRNNIAYVWAEKEVHDLSQVNEIKLILMSSDINGSNLKVVY